MAAKLEKLTRVARQPWQPEGSDRPGRLDPNTAAYSYPHALRTAPERAQSQTATKAKQYVLILAQPACMRESHAIEQNSQ